MNLTRRQFLAGCGSMAAALTGVRISLLSALESSQERDIFVLVFLRGGMDGLNLIAPVNDRAYAAARTSATRILEQGESKGLPLAQGLGNLDFRLHPKAASLHELYSAGALAIVHACGLTNGTRSHFTAMDMMERGVVDAGYKSASSGWLTRHLELTKSAGLLPAVATGSILPDTLLGYTQASSIPDLGSFAYYGGDELMAALREMHQGNSWVQRAGVEALRVLDTVSSRIPRALDGSLLDYAPEKQARYSQNGDTEISTALKTVARLIKMNIGLETAVVDYGGWDTHEYQEGYFPGLLEALSQALHGFYNDLWRYHARLTVVVLSEFGRRLKANESGGTDHGHGNAMLVLGGHINGGRMFGHWPGLATEQLDNQVDLAVTVDYRQILSEILIRRLRNPRLGQIFPGLREYQPLGLVRGMDLPIVWN